MEEKISAEIINNKIYIVTKEEATLDQIENAINLRENRAMLIASALHGGHAIGFHVAISNITNDKLQHVADNLHKKDVSSVK